MRNREGSAVARPAEWTAEIVGQMHIHGITAKQLAEAVGWHEKYLSTVMNGHRKPKGAEEKLKSALCMLVSSSDNTTSAVQ